MKADDFSGSVERVIARSAAAIYDHDEYAMIDFCVIGNLGFVWDGRVMHIRVMCPDNRMQELVTYDQERARSRRYVAKRNADRKRARRERMRA